MSCLASVLRHIYSIVVWHQYWNTYTGMSDAIDELSGVSIETLYMTVVDAIDELSGVSIETHIQDCRWRSRWVVWRQYWDTYRGLSLMQSMSCLASILRHIYMSVVGAIDKLSGVSIETLYMIVVDAIDELSGVSIETHIHECRWRSRWVVWRQYWDT